MIKEAFIRGFYKRALYWSKDIQKKILTPDHNYPVSYLTGEAGELVDAIGKMDYDNFKEEIGDVLYASQMIPYQRLGVNAPVFFADEPIKKFYDRMEVWDKILAKKKVKRDNRYFTGGSNYRKPSKIVSAFRQAGIDVSEQEALSMLKDLNIEPETV